ncbi:dihydrodipicolinate synthase family protein [Thermogymnomonas acidicola]|uniref:dihydrodipicolinate synthase family protein n=1 Tax=Thermogymnomonas acidicola TaxID=399579 RepID=UPI00094628BA|nr:dihydrodipicolinate synthase family protein [Thermogymnomonas acidicola]
MAKAMVAAVTPFRNGSLDREAASRLVEFARAMGFDGLFFGSSTGWSAALSRKQHMELMEFAASQGGVEVLAGISRNNVDETLEMGRFVSDLGIRRAVLVTPYYHRYSQASMFRYFSLISSSLDLDVYLYDNPPALTGTSLSLETVRRLHEECSNVVGIKDSSGGSVKRIAELAGLGISVFQGKDSVLLESIEAGAEGGAYAPRRTSPTSQQS